MTPDRSERLRQLFTEALRQPTTDRSAFLSSSCGSDVELLREIESLLTQSNSTTTTIQGLRLRESVEPGASAGLGLPTDAKQTEDDQFGRYTILKLIGEGGMGTVYLVEQTQPIRRQVALKVVKLGMDTRQVIARFESERQALAMMEHPNIAQIHDAGTSEKGRPYFVMEYVPGVAITQYCDEHLLDTRERLKLFETICEALQHAHQKGVIHRDIKPTNVLVFEQDGKPFPKVIDFGIAKATDQRAAEQSAFTQMGSLVGTPEYMSPEQANLTSPNVDTATDVYSLGVLLYELLAGALPFEGKSLRQAGLAELLRIIREEVPPTPSARITQLGETATEVARCRRTNPPTLRRQLTGDLNWIVMKALEKDRSRRYASMSEFAADIERHLGDQPVLAGPPSALYRAHKFSRRHRVGVAAGLLVAASLVAGMITTGWEARVAEARRREARARELTADAALLQTEDPALALYLGWGAKQMGRPLPPGLEAVLATSLANGPSFGVLRNLGARVVAWSPDGKILSADFGPTIRLWEAATGKALGAPQGELGHDLAVAWSPDSRTLATADFGGTIRLREAATGQPQHTLEGHQGRVLGVAWSPDGRTLASAGDDSTVRLWDLATGQPRVILKAHRYPVNSVAWSPDGKILASAGADRTIRLWEVASGEPLTVRGHQSSVNGVAWSPDGRVLASASQDQTIRLWESTSGQLLHTLQGHTGNVCCVVWSPDGKTITSASDDRTIRLWEAATGRSLRTLLGHQGDVLSVAWSQDGRTLVSAGSDHTIRLWDVSDQGLRTLQGHQAAVFSVAWSPDGKTLASGSGDRMIRLWDAAGDQAFRVLQGCEGRVRTVAWRSDGKVLASVSEEDRMIRLWDVASGQPLLTLQRKKGIVDDVAWSPDGKTLASANSDKMVRQWDASSGQLLRTLQGHQRSVSGVAWSPDGQTLASASLDGEIRLWNAANGQPIRTLQGTHSFLHSVAWSPDGKSLASGDWGETIRLWEAATGQPLLVLQDRSGRLNRVAWSPDGKTLAAPSSDKAIQLWDAASGQPLRTLRGHQGPVFSVAWSPDGKTLASASDDQTIRLWPGTLDTLLDQVRHSIRLFTPSTADCQRYFESDSCPLVR